MLSAKRLEKYTLKYPQEVLIVKVETPTGEDEIVIYKGFSSSLMRATAFDPDIPVLGETEKIISVDRLAAPYNPNNPKYIKQGLSCEEMEKILIATKI